MGARVAIELARQGRALSVVAISPSGMGIPAERIWQGALMVTARGLNQMRRPWSNAEAASVPGRSALLAGLPSMPWLASRTEALAVKGGFAAQRGFWPMLWNAIMIDVPTGLSEIQCPVILAQGSLDFVGSGQSPRFAAAIPGSRFSFLPGGVHAPQSDTPRMIVDLVRDAAGLARGDANPAVAS